MLVKYTHRIPGDFILPVWPKVAHTATITYDRNGVIDRHPNILLLINKNGGNIFIVEPFINTNAFQQVVVLKSTDLHAFGGCSHDVLLMVNFGKRGRVQRIMRYFGHCSDLIMLKHILLVILQAYQDRSLGQFEHSRYFISFKCCRRCYDMPMVLAQCEKAIFSILRIELTMHDLHKLPF